MCDRCDEYWSRPKPTPVNLFPDEPTVKLIVALELPKHTVDTIKAITEMNTEKPITAKEAFQAAIVFGVPELVGFLEFTRRNL
jgi:hypothetical protein